MGELFAVHAAAAVARGAAVWTGSQTAVGAVGPVAGCGRARGGDRRSRAGNAAIDQQDSRRCLCSAGCIDGRISAEGAADAACEWQTVPILAYRLGRRGANNRALRG